MKNKIKYLSLAFFAFLFVGSMPSANAQDIRDSFVVEGQSYGAHTQNVRDSLAYYCDYDGISRYGEGRGYSNHFPCRAGTYSVSFINWDYGFFPIYSNDFEYYRIYTLKKHSGGFVPLPVIQKKVFGKYKMVLDSGTKEYDSVQYKWTYGDLYIDSSQNYSQLLGPVFLEDSAVFFTRYHNGDYYSPRVQEVALYDSRTQLRYNFGPGPTEREIQDTAGFAFLQFLNGRKPIGCISKSNIPLQDPFFYGDSSWRNTTYEDPECENFDTTTFLNDRLSTSSGFVAYYKENSPYYDPNFNLNIFSNAGFEDTEQPVIDSLSEYNQCHAYYSSVKTYTEYDRHCYNSLLDRVYLSGSSQDLDYHLTERTAINNRDGEGDGPQTTDRLCGLFKGYKKSYKSKYADQRTGFLEDAQANRLNPQTLDIKGYCGEKPDKFSIFSQSGFSSLISSISSIFGKIGSKIDVGSGEYLSQNTFEKEMGKYTAYAVACRDHTYMPTPYDGRKSYIIGYDLFFAGDNNENVCRYAEDLKTKLDQKYGNKIFEKGYILGAENELGGKLFNDFGGLDLSGNQSTIANLPESVFSESQESVGSIMLSKITQPFNSGYNSILNLNCAVNRPHIEIMDYVGMVLLILLTFLFFKLL